MSQGARLVDENLLLLKDADMATSNQYNIRLLDDTFNALNVTYDILPIDHPKLPNQVPSTAILPSEYRASFSHFAFRVSHFIPFDKYPRVSPTLVIGNLPRVFSRDLRQEDAAAEIAISRSPSGHGWIASRGIRGEFGESVSILRHRHSLASYLKHSLYLQCVKEQWLSNLRADCEHGSMW